MDAEQAERDRPPAGIDAFLGEPTRRLDDWRWLWDGDHAFPIRSHRGIAGRLLVWCKRLLRPLVKLPQNDLWERQRVFNLILLESLQHHQRQLRDQQEQLGVHDRRLRHLEAFMADGLAEVMRHNDALFARVDQKLDCHRREVRELLGALQGALAALPPAAAGEAGAALPAELDRALSERGYLELERRYRGTREDVEQRIAHYLPYLERPAVRAGGPVLDLGCGRGEALAVLGRHGIPARGVDRSAEMVARCRQQGLAAEPGDLFAYLAAVPAGSLGAVVSFHVIEHLPAVSLERLVQLAWRALAPGGVLVLETPNPLSVVVAARNFWLDPTHQRPVHPASLRLFFELAGFDPVEHLELRPFAVEERLPEIDLAALPREQQALADRVNRLRDRLDELLFGCQDYALIGTR